MREKRKTNISVLKGESKLKPYVREKEEEYIGTERGEQAEALSERKGRRIFRVEPFVSKKRRNNERGCYQREGMGGNERKRGGKTEKGWG